MVKGRKKLDNRSILGRLPALSTRWRIVGILIVMSALGGCVSKESKPGAEIPVQNISEENLSLYPEVPMNTTNISDPNQIRLLVLSKELNRTGRLPIVLLIKNPRLNESVLTVFKPEVGQEWYNQTTITSTIKNNNWMQNFSIKPRGDTRYVWMYVQISENNTVVKKAAWNITFEAPVEMAT
ncbi:Uncharacterised protein [uncultured archaeon]|nr:Uncharacterised protein [uncultured archaeon]